MTLEERFWAKVDKSGPNGCWLWTGALNSSGYGAIDSGGRNHRPLPAHRVAYELLVGPILEGLEPDHLCRVRHCVNPAHLEPVTHKENIRRGLKARGVPLAPGRPQLTQIFKLADLAVGGRLALLLRKWQAEGLNRDQIATRLADVIGTSLTGRTIDNWLRDIEVEASAS